MRFDILALFSLSVSVVYGYAQDASAAASDSGSVDALLASLATLPDSAQSCITNALPAANCALGDLACLCTSVPFTEATLACVQVNCTIKEALATLAIFFRFLARGFFLEGSLGWDDWTCLLGYLFLIPCTAIVQIMSTRGLGHDIWMVPFDNITSVLYYFFIEEYLYIGFVMATKISIVLLYLRIIPGTVSPKFRALCLTVIGLMVAYTMAFIIALALQCRPISYSWTQWDGEHKGKCINLEAQVYCGAILNICWDLVVFVLPIPRLLNLQVRDTRKKVMVILTFLVGLFGTVCSIIRLRYLTQWGKTANATMHYNNIAIWSAAEGDVGVICACMPAIAGPILRFFRNYVATHLSRNRTKFSGVGSKGSGAGGSKIGHKIPSSAGTDTARGEVHHVALEKGGGISKTVTASMYNMPYETHSDDDVELMGRSHARGQDVGSEEGDRAPGLSAARYKHEYAGSWR
ncbi:hypothetical protein LTR62_006497 [Meristemomyces frigidus]|uniref:CFEM domain-containing protein n=1 Tax=Meristemomyces frigidus TaxID=1508187 RepID=A0AAN7TG77_9PEZI|nr:hypothetical protein LTR62_006497 [Meristemomyces frigidus]